MKALNKYFPLLLLTIYGSSLKANTLIDSGKFSKEYAINTYVNAMALGKLDGLNDVINDSANFVMLQGVNINSYAKEDVMKYFGLTENTKQDCTTNFSFIVDTKYYAIVM